MTLTGFLFLSEALLSEVDSHVAYTLGQWSANWWIPPFAALILGFPSGRLSSRVDWAIVGAFVFGTVVGQLVWLLFFPFPGGQENVFLISADPGTANTIDRFESGFNATVGLALAIVGISRWLRAAPPLRRLLLPTLAGALTALVLIIQIYYALLTGEFIRSSQEVTSVLLVSVPLAFLFGILHQQLARAGMADLVVALHRAPGVARGSATRSRRRSATRRSCSRTGCRASTPTSTRDGSRWRCRRTGSGARGRRSSSMTGQHVAALIHDAALAHQPDLLEVVCAAASVALEQRAPARPSWARGSSSCRHRASASSRRATRSGGGSSATCTTAPSSASSRSRCSCASCRATSATTRRRRSSWRRSATSSRCRWASCASWRAACTRRCSSTASPPALESLAPRSTVATTVSYEPRDRLPEPVELAAYFVASEALANVAQVRPGDERHDARLARRPRWRASRSPTTASAAPTTRPARACAGSPIASRRCRAACASSARPASGTIVTAELPCGS